MHTILVPIDFSSESELALLIAGSVARDLESELVFLYVIQPQDCSEDKNDAGKLDRDSVSYQSCWNQFLRLQPLLHGVRASFQVKIGPIVETIEAVAQSECADLIVIAAHQKSYFHHQIYGSVSESLARRSSSPVVCINQSPVRRKMESMLNGLRRSLLLSDVGH
jgi:nucleotide-binding universal stress UspA family protein